MEGDLSNNVPTKENVIFENLLHILVFNLFIL